MLTSEQRKKLSELCANKENGTYIPGFKEMSKEKQQEALADAKLAYEAAYAALTPEEKEEWRKIDRQSFFVATACVLVIIAIPVLFIAWWFGVFKSDEEKAAEQAKEQQIRIERQLAKEQKEQEEKAAAIEKEKAEMQQLRKAFEMANGRWNGIMRQDYENLKRSETFFSNCLADVHGSSTEKVKAYREKVYNFIFSCKVASEYATKFYEANAKGNLEDAYTAKERFTLSKQAADELQDELLHTSID